MALPFRQAHQLEEKVVTTDREIFEAAFAKVIEKEPGVAPGRTALNRAMEREPYKSLNGYELGWYQNLMLQYNFVKHPRTGRWMYVAPTHNLER